MKGKKTFYGGTGILNSMSYIPQASPLPVEACLKPLFIQLMFVWFSFIFQAECSTFFPVFLISPRSSSLPWPLAQLESQAYATIPSQRYKTLRAIKIEIRRGVYVSATLKFTLYKGKMQQSMFLFYIFSILQFPETFCQNIVYNLYLCSKQWHAT